MPFVSQVSTFHISRQAQGTDKNRLAINVIHAGDALEK